MRNLPTRLSKLWRLSLSQAEATLADKFNLRRLGSNLGRGEARDGRSF